VRPVVKFPSIIVLVHNEEQYRPEGFSWDCPPACDGEGPAWVVLPPLAAER
jgi:hypothetical protein